MCVQKQLAQLRALLEARKAEGHKKVFICAPLLSCIDHLDDNLDAQWAAEGLLDASGTELELPAGYSPLCFPLVIRVRVGSTAFAGSPDLR